MIASAVYYFSLLSVPWMLLVRALTPEQTNEINSFLQYTGPDLLVAFHHVTKPTLDAYLRESIHNLGIVLDPYLNNLGQRVHNGMELAPPPDFDSDFYWELAGLTNFVNLIKYENLCLLHELKGNLISKYGQHTTLSPESILWMINNDKIKSAWAEYETSHTSGAGKQFATYMVDIAMLYSMNTTMLGLIGPNDRLFGRHVRRVAVYNDMIIGLHSSMARYLQVATRCSYSGAFMTFETQFNLIAINVDIGYRMNQTRHLAFDLSHHILAVIAIYGFPPETGFRFVAQSRAIPGTEILSKLFKSQWDIRRLIGQEIFMDVNDDDWILWVLRNFREELLKIEQGITFWRFLYIGSEWVMRLRRMVNMALSVLDPHSQDGPTGINNPPGHAGPSGTN
jgi:hypothetical protein